MIWFTGWIFRLEEYIVRLVMPVYEYKCKKCEKEFEIVQKISENALTICPDETCGGEIFRKISKNVGFLFKGSGFYQTDYVKKNGSYNGNAHSNGNGHTSKEESHSDSSNENSEVKKDTSTVKNETTPPKNGSTAVKKETANVA
jgi:putative FmdB family regulatory protein